jgi:hypothetical protein
MNETIRRTVRERAEHRCEYCRVPQQFDPLEFVIDHIIARKHGGSNDSGNLALACYACNLFKGPNIAGFDHEKEEIIRLFNPRADAWTDHFKWRGAYIDSFTVIGRVTAFVLAFNSPDRVEFRRELVAEGILAPE